mmetsp:Transcript_1558/g.2751  ORF Transcript_1558/g.2751 Transcript_1558/m.2751 type:complete len:95 (-) Transcript_1558:289-573(-)
MRNDQLIVKTNCNGSNEAQIAGSSQSQIQDQVGNPLDQTNEFNLLHGHKFHQECFKRWIQKGIDSLQDPNCIYRKCPLCRQDIMKDLEPLQAQA